MVLRTTNLRIEGADIDNRLTERLGPRDIGVTGSLVSGEADYDDEEEGENLLQSGYRCEVCGQIFKDELDYMDHCEAHARVQKRVEEKGGTGIS